jgi:hypothetical protein
MKFFSPLSIGASLLACAAVPALGAVTVSSPGNASFVTSPFTLTASASSCSGQATSTMGYSLDSSASTTVVNGAYIQESVSAGAGGAYAACKVVGDQRRIVRGGCGSHGHGGELRSLVGRTQRRCSGKRQHGDLTFHTLCLRFQLLRPNDFGDGVFA